MCMCVGVGARAELTFDLDIRRTRHYTVSRSCSMITVICQRSMMSQEENVAKLN